jgi:RNA polymerase-binding transcription factor DksA
VSDADPPSLAPLEATLDGVEHALERLREGTYHRCERCAQPIEDADLEADPLVATCRAHRAAR